MMLSSTCRYAGLAAILASSSLANATPAHNVCVPNALGVPTRFMQPPKWVDWGAGQPGVVEPIATALDDPRWEGAVGQSFGLGSAKAPLGMRAVWSHQDADYLYMSFIMDLEGLAGTGTETPRDLFLGFRRSTPFDPGTPTDPTDDEYGYVFQFHLTTGDSPSLVEPVHCARPLDSNPGVTHDGCSEQASQPKDYWRVYVDLNQTNSACGSTTAEHFNAVPTGDTKAPWVAAKQAVRYWKLSTANRWAIQLRLPLADAGHPLSDGIDRTSTLWYEATAQTSSGGDFADIGWWPRELTSSVCVSLLAGGFLDHKELSNPDAYSRLSEITGSTSGCDGGIQIQTADIGSLPDFSGAASALATADLSGAVAFKGLRSDGVTPVVNTVVAQVENTSGAAVDQPLSARFRLALWGSAPWSFPPPEGKWKDIRATVPTTAGQQPGICLGNSDPNAADSCTPAVSIGAGGKGAISFQWTLGNDSVMGLSEFCQFGLKPPGAGTTSGCDTTCSCAAAGSHCDAATDNGTRSTVGAGGPCVSNYFGHECMLVELSAPNGNVDFAQQSAWNNMNFDQMSIVAREALIDARQLPTRPGQLEQNIYLIAMPRNMPHALPGGSTSGATLIRQSALVSAEAIATPYLNDIAQQPPEKIREAVQRLGRAQPRLVALESTGGNGGGVKSQDPPNLRERVAKVQQAIQVMPDRDNKRVSGLLQIALASSLSASDLSQALVSQVGAINAADVVPTLEIYPFYQPGGTGNAFLPMTAFTVFLSHEGSLNGMNWVIDGATRIGQNIYQMKIPVGFARKIQVRAEAIESTDVLPPGNPAWPCAGGGCLACGGANRNCGLLSGLSTGGPGVIAGMFVMRRRRKKPAKPAKSA